ncbi:hypothetical protein ABDI30_17540 [Paenibacillus cisolokensis]|uniref:phage distal tail protein n=1 Tax=Paenibacillus cisolokensis TaxID=1658519 RepID=UPI003D2C62B0
MFGGGFNDLAFNSATEGAVNIVDLEARLSGEGRVLVDKFTMEMAATAHLSGEGRLSAEYIREYSLEPERMSGEGRLSAVYVREIRYSSRLSGQGRLNANATKFHIDYIEFTDVFRPGDVIIIDSGKFKITRNGVNVSHLYEGDFFDLNLGTNNLTWTDPATGRTILFRITHRDKFLY